MSDLKEITAIILPTYNSKNGIVKLLSQILISVKRPKIVIVDDNSPDGTGKIVKKSFKSNKSVVVLERNNKQGRGSAVIAGFKYALKDKNIKYIIEMDSDFAHNPKDIPKLIKTIKKYDMVVASKYLPSSRITKWNYKRKILSKMANTYIKFVLGIPLKDNTNGFRCYRREVLESIDLDRIKARGFIVLTEIAFFAYKNKFRIREVPINFTSQNLNRSNMSIQEIISSFLTVLRIKFSDNFKLRQRKYEESSF